MARRSAQDSAFTVRQAGDSLLLSNADSVPIYFAVFRTGLLPLIEWTPCDTSVTCPHVPPRDSVRVAVPQAFSSAREVVTVFWWRLGPVPGAGGRWAADRVRPIEMPPRSKPHP